MQGRWKVWLEMSDREQVWDTDEYVDPELGDEPYWFKFRTILASLDSQGIEYEISFDNENGRDYALVTTMPAVRQLTLEDICPQKQL